MFPFTYTKVANTWEAVAAGQRGGRYVAGGTTLVDLMRETVERPEALVDIAALPLRDITTTRGGGLRIGALVSMSEAAEDRRVRDAFPLISEALELSASAQLRNMATIGGNIMQRTRCTCSRDVTAPCNKRVPGSGCAALEGFNRTHAILGGSDQCVATHPSDVAVACAALEAGVRLLGPAGERTVPFTDFLRQPGTTPNREQALQPGELITAVEIPAHPRPLRSGYLKVRDRQSYEFALTSAAVALHVQGGVIRAAKVAAGGVCTVPWRLPAVEQHLIGERPSNTLWTEAAALAADGARPWHTTVSRSSCSSARWNASCASWEAPGDPATNPAATEGRRRPAVACGRTAEGDRQCELRRRPRPRGRHRGDRLRGRRGQQCRPGPQHRRRHRRRHRTARCAGGAQPSQRAPTALCGQPGLEQPAGQAVAGLPGRPGAVLRPAGRRRGRDHAGGRAARREPGPGVAPAIANAVFHATGRRIRDFPITAEALL